MNLVGKIFTVIIFLLCIMFTSMATMVFSTHQNWLLTFVDKSKEADNLKKTIANLTNEKAALDVKAKGDHDALEAKNAELQTQINLVAPKLATAEKRILEVEDQNRGLDAAVKGAHLTLDSMRAESEKLRTEARDALAERDKRYTELVKATDEWHTAAGERDRLAKSNGELAARLASDNAFFQRYKLDPKNADKDLPADTFGVVTAVLGTGEIEISLGSDDGLKKEHRLVVERAGSPISFVGWLIVDKLSGARAVCHSDKTLQRSAIQKGDYVLAPASVTKSKR